MEKYYKNKAIEITKRDLDDWKRSPIVKAILEVIDDYNKWATNKPLNQEVLLGIEIQPERDDIAIVHFKVQPNL